MPKHPRIAYKFERLLLAYHPEIGARFMNAYRASNESCSSQDVMVSLSRFIRAQLELCRTNGIALSDDPRNHVRDSLPETDWLTLVEARVVPIIITQWGSIPTKGYLP